MKGQSELQNIKIPVSELKFYNEELSDWELEKGKYMLYIGNASDNIVETRKISIL
ncbi:fibronectin type III-like domain-contianing protein [Bacteroidales bacterium]|nr:fibronectin type III-like domain-contianing protein [Bacteroidales bacterium]